MVQRTDLLNTIGLIAALLLPLNDSADENVHTKPMWLGITVKALSNISFFSNLYALISTLTASYWAVQYEVYGDVWRPVYGLTIAFFTFVFEKFLGAIVECFGLVDSAAENAFQTTKQFEAPWSPWMFGVYVVPFTLTIVAICTTYCEQGDEAASDRKERVDQGLKPIDPEYRRKNDRFNGVKSYLKVRM